MAVRGNFAELKDLRSGLAAFAGSGSGGFYRRVSKGLAEEARTQVSESFERGVDPYDRPWAPLTSRHGHPLRDTGRFMNSFTTIAERTFFTISTNFIGAAVHQYGATIRPKNAKVLAFTVRGAPTKRNRRGKASRVFAREVTIPRRQYMPEDDIPSRWGRAFDAVADLLVLRELRRLGVAY